MKLQEDEPQEEPCTPACGKQYVGEHHSEHCLHFDGEQCAQCDGETFVVEITRCRGCENEFYTRDQSLTASRAFRAASGHGFVGGDGLGGKITSFTAHPEDAPEGPWEIGSTMEPDAFVVRKSGVKCGRGPFTWAEVVAVCDRLNRLHRSMGDGK